LKKNLLILLKSEYSEKCTYIGVKRYMCGDLRYGRLILIVGFINLIGVVAGA
jgi:hypothetical protein